MTDKREEKIRFITENLRVHFSADKRLLKELSSRKTINIKSGRQSVNFALIQMLLQSRFLDFSRIFVSSLSGGIKIHRILKSPETRASSLSTRRVPSKLTAKSLSIKLSNPFERYY